MSEAAKKLDDATSPLMGLALYDDLLIPVCAVDAAGVVCYFNSTFTSFIKLSPRKIRGKILKEVISSKVITSTDLVERCHKEWLPMVSEETTIDVGGEEVRDAIFKLIPHTSPDGSRQVVLTVQDVSIERILHAKHRVQLDELKAKNDEIKKYSEGLEILVDERTKELREAMAQSERLLLNVLPKKIADTLKIQQGTIAQRHDMVTVLFCDIVNFTPISGTMDPRDVVEFLSKVYDCFDKTLDKYKVEKIKTIGDCYLAVTGAPEFDPDHAVNMCNFALDMREEILRINEQLSFDLELRFGMNSGPVVAGVIGQRKFAYDIWGDAVNVASRMESHGESNKIQISSGTYDLVKDLFKCEERGMIKIKGKGDFMAYWLVGRK
jgi:class 3 adenylate cyclase